MSNRTARAEGPRQRPVGARLCATLALATALSGCGVTDWFGASEPPPLPGTRIAVLANQTEINPDPEISSQPIAVPAPETNADWPLVGGTPNHVVGNPALPGTLREAWRVGIGNGSSSSRLLTAQPVVAGGRVYAMDAAYEVSAYEAQTGRRLWAVAVRPERDAGDPRGGGVGFGDGRLYATTGFGEALALDPANGSILWRQKLPAPARSAPTVVGGRLFVVTSDNQLVALSAADGNRLWGYTGIAEMAGVAGGAAPAVDGSVVVAPFSSGEVVALRAENGRLVWGDSLAAIRRTGAISQLADIVGSPVVGRGLVFAVSHSGRMAAIDVRSGGRAWEHDIGGRDMPWVAGDMLYVMSLNAELVAITRQSGRVRWVRQFDRLERPDRRDRTIQWTGPVMAGSRLWLANTRRELLAVDPATGETVQVLSLPDAVRIPPVVAGGTMYVLTDGGQLIAYR